MRNMMLGTIVGVAMALPGAAFAQATRSADDYVCQLTGECGAEEGAEVTKDAPATKGFSLTRKPAAGEATKKVGATKGFSLTREERPAAAAATKPVRSVSRGSTAPTRMATAITRRAPAKTFAPTASAGARGDLSLSFETGSAVLTAAARANARAFADALNRPALAGKKVLIEGHTDRQGSREMNLELSQRRAQAVADFLKANGVAADRLRVQGFGFDRPVSDSAEQNRRVEAVLES